MSLLVCIGLSYKTAPIELRERVALTATQQQVLLDQVSGAHLPGVDELAILSTCNRTEFYAVGDGARVKSAIFDLWHAHGLPPDALAATYTLENEQCVQHLCRVAAGLESQVIGEQQILGQVTDAYENARKSSATGPLLAALMRAAIQSGKRVRASTTLTQGVLSIGSVAAHHANEILGTECAATVLIIGAGEMARVVAAAFIRKGVDRLLIVNHSLDHAQALATEWDGEVVPFTRLMDALSDADMVITATASPHVILQRLDLDGVVAARADRPLLIFDVALPRNVAPDVATLAGVRLYNLDDLRAVSEAHYAVRQSAIPAAEQIAAEEAEAFLRWQASRAAVPVIQTLRARVEEIREAELRRLFGRMPEITDHDRQAVEEFSRRLVNKLLHEPTQTLKQKTAAGDGEQYIGLMQELFHLTSANAE